MELGVCNIDTLIRLQKDISPADRVARLMKPLALGMHPFKCDLFLIQLGVQALHAAGIIHRDIRPVNLILSSDGELKIADFGLSRQITTGSKYTKNTGINLQPKEVIDAVESGQETPIKKESDIFMLGMNRSSARN